MCADWVQVVNDEVSVDEVLIFNSHIADYIMHAFEEVSGLACNTGLQVLLSNKFWKGSH